MASWWAIWRVRGGGWVRTTSRPSPLEPTSGQPSGADALVRGTQGRPSVVTRRDRTRRDGDRRSPRFSICLPTALGRDVVASRAINWGNDPSARGAYSYATSKTTGSAVSPEKTGSWSHILCRRGALCRPGNGHGRGSPGQRTRNSAEDPGRRTIGFQATALRNGFPGLPNGIHFGATGAIGEGAIRTRDR
jgi:hypothetical protein